MRFQKALELEQSEFDDDSLAVFPTTYAVLGLCQLNQWALDFEGNLRRVMQSIEEVKRLGAFYRLGPELELSGYSCDEHFNEFDTTGHCWQSLLRILQSELSHNCLLDIGMPVEHKSVRYNCRIFILNKEILLIRPKIFLAQDGAYRENRYFGSWLIDNALETFVLPKSVQRLTSQYSCPIGFAAIQCNDCIVAAESCEELFVPQSPHLAMCLGGVDIFANGSGSYFEVNKMKRRFDLIMAPTQKMGGIYMYCNAKGNDGGQLLFDGNSFIACNGSVVNIISPMTPRDVEVMVERVNINSVRSYRASNPSYSAQASGTPCPVVRGNIWLSGVDNSSIREIRTEVEPSVCETSPSFPCGAEEIALNISCWLWDYLRRSGASGFVVALSGGADSALVASLVRYMCDFVFTAVHSCSDVRQDLEKVLKIDHTNPIFPKNGAEMAYLILHTLNMRTTVSSQETRQRAAAVAKELNAFHLELDISDLVASQVDLVRRTFGFLPKYKSAGGTQAQDLTLQNAQARCRMTTTYTIASMLPSYRSTDRLAPPPTFDNVQQLTEDKVQSDQCNDFFLSLGTGNIDETIRGYFTKYDCSSGDLAPIGALSKLHIRRVLSWAARRLDAPTLYKVLDAAPTAELRPEDIAGPQTDEVDMGLTYNELYVMGNMRKCDRFGPVEMFENIIHRWHKCGGVIDVEAVSPSRVTSLATEITAINEFFSDPDLSYRVIGEKVKHFFTHYAKNRHKTVTLPPSMHAEPYDCESSRYDWRPFMYPPWTRQFKQIDDLIKLAETQAFHPPSSSLMVPPRRQIFVAGIAGGTK